MRAFLFLVFRVVVIAIQMAGLLAFLIDYSGWSLLPSVLVAVLLVMFLPLVATVLGFIGALKVWLWPWWLALLVFLPGLALSLMAIAGVGAASLLSVFILRRLQRRQGNGAAGFRYGRFRPPGGSADAAGSGPVEGGQGQTIEGEVISSRVDGERDGSNERGGNP